MKKVLYINGNPQKEAYSYSRRTGAYYLEQLKNSDSDIQVASVNVYEQSIPLIDEDVLTAWAALGNGTDYDELTVDQQEKIGQMNQLLEQFKASDEVVIVSPLWNFGLTPMLKAYIDNITIVGQTFKYTENGPVGLMTGKKATIIQASGGVYSKGPAVGMEHGVNYLKTVLQFIGITDIKTLLAEGIAMPDKTEEEKLAEAYKQVDDIFDLDYV